MLLAMLLAMLWAENILKTIQPKKRFIMQHYLREKKSFYRKISLNLHSVRRKKIQKCSRLCVKMQNFAKKAKYERKCSRRFSSFAGNPSSDRTAGFYFSVSATVFFPKSLTLNRLGRGRRLAPPPPSSFFCPSTLIFDTITVTFFDFS